MHRIFGQAHPDGVSHSLGEQGTDSDGALDATVFPVAGFGPPRDEWGSSSPHLLRVNLAVSIRYAEIMTFGLLAFIEKMRSW